MKCVSYTPLPCSICNTYSRIKKQKGCLLPVANTLKSLSKNYLKGLNLGFIQKINLANLQVQNKNTNFATVNFLQFIKIALAVFGLLSFTGFKPFLFVPISLKNNGIRSLPTVKTLLIFSTTKIAKIM